LAGDDWQALWSAGQATLIDDLPALPELSCCNFYIPAKNINLAHKKNN
jgi:hypothetical protein